MQIWTFAAIVSCAGLSPALAADFEANPPAIDQQQVIDDIAATLRANYVFPDKVSGIKARLEEKRKAGRYDKVATTEELATLLSADLVDATGDLHFNLAYVPQTDSSGDPVTVEPPGSKRVNYEFKRVEVLPGNVGYIRFDYFSKPDDVFDTVTDAMKFVENSDALIIDMRYNRGGHLATAQLLMSYLFSDEKDLQLFDYFYNEDGKTIKRGQWVMSGIPGHRMTGTPVYILTSTTTFSAAEWMTYSLRKLGRVTIVGEQSAGAAHPVAEERVNDNFIVQVPIGIINGPGGAIDFEGVGVAPDVNVASHLALSKAHELALTTIAQDDPASDARWYLPVVGGNRPDAKEVARDTRDIIGNYEGRQVSLRDGTLVYSWRDRFSIALTPLGGGLFQVEGTDDYRVRLLREGGRVKAISREFRDGGSSEYRRLK